ncbi:MAG: DUF1318 domain-containing protein [Candidatus Hydrogenedentes bacterium]|nr:DUF1318 domain-containing protein [Candidatus Hydrogenedentota bacterium]
MKSRFSAYAHRVHGCEDCALLPWAHLAALLALCLLPILSACKTGGIVNPFVAMKPDYSEVNADALRAAARDIEAAVKQGNRDFALGTYEGLNLDTDELKQAIRTRAARVQLVQDFLNSGHAYEQNNGLLNIQRTSAYKKFGTSRDRDRNALLVMGENNDRWMLYEGIVEANNYSGRSLSAIQSVFHQARVELLESGQKYQNEAGEILVK